MGGCRRLCRLSLEGGRVWWIRAHARLERRLAWEGNVRVVVAVAGFFWGGGGIPELGGGGEKGDGSVGDDVKNQKTA